MNKQIEKLLATAAAEIGTVENPPNSNEVKYNDWYYGKSVRGSSYPWCCVFVSWCFMRAELSHIFCGGKRFAGCTSLMNWAKTNGKWVSVDDLQPGDCVLFEFDADPEADHIGILERVDGALYITLEGNTSASTAGSQSNGGCVARRTRKRDVIKGGYRPDYDEKPPFAIPDWATDGVTYAVDSGLLNPSGDAEDYWTRAVNRIELAVVLERLRGLK